MDYMQDDQPKQFDYVVVGAGFSGAYCAGQLAKRGFRVAIVDKARGTGGRLSSKRLNLDDQPIGFDLGAHSFEVSNANFDAYLKSRRDVVIQEGESRKRAYSLSRNSSFARGALGEATPYFGKRVLEARFEDGVWSLVLESREGKSALKATHCVLAAPPKQAAQILGEHHPLFGQLDAVEHEAQWVAMFALGSGSKPVAELRRLVSQEKIRSDVVRDIVFDHDKQGRDKLEELEVVVVHAQPDWTLAQVDSDPEMVADRLLQEVASLIDKPVKELRDCILTKHVHRWLYARPKAAYRLAGGYLSSAADNLLICGDYFTVNSEFGVESAFLSAHALLGMESGAK